LESCVFITTSSQLPEPAWLSSLFAKTALTRKERLSLLSRLAPEGDEDVGRMVCSCFNVGEKTIRQAIESHHLSNVAAIGHSTKAGTGCGSCMPELKQMLLNYQLPEKQ
jgi:assimilatory nitrate reductase catalytic subunit